MTTWMESFIILAVATLLTCWVFSEYQIYADECSPQEELHRPGLRGYWETWKISFWYALGDAGMYRQETLKSENRSLFLPYILSFRAEDKKEQNVPGKNRIYMKSQRTYRMKGSMQK